MPDRAIGRRKIKPDVMIEPNVMMEYAYALRALTLKPIMPVIAFRPAPISNFLSGASSRTALACEQRGVTRL